MGRKKSHPKWFLPGWVHRRLREREKFAQVRALWGDDCWRCNKPMRFEGPPNCGKAATIEHLTPLSKDGTWALDNLRLCHVGCNRHLGDRPREQKERMRINLRPAQGRP
jgi:5-methylcytosine-specific restriction endonuclease McrA